MWSPAASAAAVCGRVVDRTLEENVITDAKGQTNLIAAGPLSTVLTGYPINYHGFDEGAPVEACSRGASSSRLLVSEREASARPASPVAD